MGSCLSAPIDTSTYPFSARTTVFLSISIDNGPAERIVIQLYNDISPKTSANFHALCTGEKGVGGSGCKLWYKGSSVHRVKNGQFVQGGDFTHGNGRGGESIFGERFADENFDLKHDKAGLLSMANSGKDTNGSQFFITSSAAPQLDGKHVVFGEVLEGMDVVHRIERIPVDANDKPLQPVTIVDCGAL
ncbi:mitochondrial peptidyl-prolyl cis-trans isomerase D [Pterulicium gracile]|uniref:Peptidyl-prolyl cis-trans isomerase n=1 Tax=Pterulicium gracile TaxID=1884261 RepID=A0A5C3Q6I5_9AGAR|nr:mitochondrial peptidyl-prolyl cis-trans isomerase D [Pterula gracilis]